MSELISRARLFSAVEGGSTFWAREVFTNGSTYVLDRALTGGYDPVKYARTIEKLRASSADQLLQSISDAQATFLTPADSNWPQSVNDLAAPPIALVIKGDPALLTGDSLAIVGTRNPTQYGVRIAQDFAAGFVDRDWSIISGGAYGIESAPDIRDLAASQVSGQFRELLLKFGEADLTGLVADLDLVDRDLGHPSGGLLALVREHLGDP